MEINDTRLNEVSNLKRQATKARNRALSIASDVFFESLKEADMSNQIDVAIKTLDRVIVRFEAGMQVREEQGRGLTMSYNKQGELEDFRERLTDKLRRLEEMAEEQLKTTLELQTRRLQTEHIKREWEKTRP
jgi:prefoldin subunit 5